MKRQYVVAALGEFCIVIITIMAEKVQYFYE
jgi:hypothetical protein